MQIHPSTFSYLKPTDEQTAKMAIVRGEFLNFVMGLDTHLPDGPDKTYIMRKLRECAMWANISITRDADGSPRA